MEKKQYLNREKLFTFFGLTFGLTVFFPAICYAYIDPGTGSFLITTILGVIAAISYTLRSYLYKIKSIFSKDKKVEDDTEANE